jgi:hypothetical protein
MTSYWFVVVNFARRQPRRRLDWGHLGYPNAFGRPLPGPGRTSGADRDHVRLEPLRRPQHGLLDPVPRTLLGLASGVGIGIVAALMGIAGGELLIPTIVLLFAVDIKIAGSLALAISLPTMLGSVRPLQPRPQLRSPARQQGLRARHGGRIDHRHHPRRSSPWCRPRRCADPPAGRAPPRVFGQGLAPRLTIKLLYPRVVRCRRAGRLARGEPNRAAGHVERMIPAGGDLTADRRPQCLRLM